MHVNFKTHKRWMPPGHGHTQCTLDMNMEELIETLKIKIIEILNLPDVTPADIPVDSDLMSSGLDIDSIDMLELVICSIRIMG